MALAALLVTYAALAAAEPNLHAMLAKTMAGETLPLRDLKGKPVLIVNVASR